MIKPKLLVRVQWWNLHKVQDVCRYCARTKVLILYPGVNFMDTLTGGYGSTYIHSSGDTVSPFSWMCGFYICLSSHRNDVLLYDVWPDFQTSTFTWKNPWAQQNHQQVVAFWDGFKSKQKSFHWSQKSCWIHQFPRCLMIRSRWKLSIWARFVLLLKILYSRQKLIEVESMTYVFSNCFLRIRNSVKSEWPS